MTNVRYVVHMNIHDREGFQEAAQECVDANDGLRGKIAYDWTIKGDQGRVYQEWADEKAFLGHLEVTGPLFPELLKHCDITTVDVLSPVSAQAKAAVEGFPTQYFEPLFQTVPA